ncbi:MAG: helix-turn-helix transcriptional regulator [Ruminococcaceae bacterium]|nr:helix-turn-helix transcriptional regulator [Oscillospiraceae bacterium]
MADTGHSFVSYFKRATSPLVVLRFLMERPMYGYEITSALKSRSGGKYQIAILYPVLYRLEEQGFVEISSQEVADGRARSYYAITPAGRAYLKKTWQEYVDISDTFKMLMNMDGVDDRMESLPED